MAKATENTWKCLAAGMYDLRPNWALEMVERLVNAKGPLEEIEADPEKWAVKFDEALYLTLAMVRKDGTRWWWGTNRPDGTPVDGIAATLQAAKTAVRQVQLGFR